MLLLHVVFSPTSKYQVLSSINIELQHDILLNKKYTQVKGQSDSLDWEQSDSLDWEYKYMYLTFEDALSTHDKFEPFK